MRIWETICAIATPLQNAPIGIIRISGDKSLWAVKKLIYPDIPQIKPRFLYLRKIYEHPETRKGYIDEVFSFIDASSLISKANLWKERDKAIEKKYEKLNNEVLPKVAFDKQAKIGCKGKDKYWYGYKKHACVDMQSGLINKVAVTPANVPDAKGYKNVCPNQGATYADKGYCTKEVNREAKRKGCHLRAIKKNNMKDKNKDLDRWISKIRAPYESVFSKQRKRTRYSGVAKNQFAVFMEAICFNLKRLTALDPPGTVFV